MPTIHHTTGTYSLACRGQNYYSFSEFCALPEYVRRPPQPNPDTLEFDSIERCQRILRSLAPANSRSAWRLKTARRLREACWRVRIGDIESLDRAQRLIVSLTPEAGDDAARAVGELHWRLALLIRWESARQTSAHTTNRTEVRAGGHGAPAPSHP